MEVPDTHIRINMVSTVTNGGAVRFMTYSGAMTAALFIVFLGRLLRDAPARAPVRAVCKLLRLGASRFSPLVADPSRPMP
jgi:hypothetical protein